MSQVATSGVNVPKRATAKLKAREKHVVRTWGGTCSDRAATIAPLYMPKSIESQRSNRSILAKVGWLTSQVGGLPP